MELRFLHVFMPVGIEPKLQTQVVGICYSGLGRMPEGQFTHPNVVVSNI